VVTSWSPPYIPPSNFPDVIVPPTVTPPGPPPCDPTKDPECPPPPPDDVPEPATLFILFAGLAAIWLAFGRQPKDRIE
jgi:hypothetical protein